MQTETTHPTKSAQVSKPLCPLRETSRRPKQNQLRGMRAARWTTIESGLPLTKRESVSAKRNTGQNFANLYLTIMGTNAPVAANPFLNF